MESILGVIRLPSVCFRTVLLGLFAFTSLVLAMVGIYGVMSYRRYAALMKSVSAWRWGQAGRICSS